ncbi:MAG TPA: P-loop NTPase fold protein [Mucilaginibacter sp.]|jgi:energy-coupling factor transporter ATP-binding protein EcfA2|nr:P-loop NTPase fold protein [Mucilaginibacter sp.]
MQPNLLTNRELENYVEQDDFNFLGKAEAIRIFLEQNSTSLKKNKMLVLYGEWGSGKTSLMKHIEQNINKDIYKTIFFHAWEHEKDENLALSLCDALTDNIDSNSQAIKDFMKGALLAFRGFTSGMTLKTPAWLSGLGLDLEISGDKINKALDDALNEDKPSFYISNKDFKKNFCKIEELILKKSDAQKLLIFIDDLDRCEPENVLNLITALKLFFTYGENTVFFCGIDKNAVKKAVGTKYRDIVKSEEYLEKVFDISFHMPQIISLKKMLESRFNGQTKLSDDNYVPCAGIIEDFFLSTRFSNPRHVKKVLNKFEIIKDFKELSAIPKETRDYIPDIIRSNGDGNVFETIFCLFAMILHEFYNEDFLELESYEEKMQKYTEPLYKNAQSLPTSPEPYTSITLQIRANLLIDDCKTFSLKSLLSRRQRNNINLDPYCFTRFIIFFSHGHPDLLRVFDDNEIHAYQNYFVDKEFTTLFCKFLIKHKTDITNNATEYPIWNLFEMVRYLL